MAVLSGDGGGRANLRCATLHEFANELLIVGDLKAVFEGMAEQDHA